MAEPDWPSVDGRLLAELMQIDDRTLWSAEELGAILQHQLDAPLEADFSRLRQSERVERAPGQAAGARFALPATPALSPGISTFRQLFEHPNPPIELLELTKRFAKSCRSRPDAPVPDEVATVLYLAAIAAARLKGGASISRLDDAALRPALDWALEQPWLDPGIGELLEGARATLVSGQKNNDG